MKNKIIFSLLIFLILFSTFFISVSNASFVFNGTDNKTYTFDDFELSKYIVILSEEPNNTAYFHVYSSEDPFFFIDVKVNSSGQKSGSFYHTEHGYYEYSVSKKTGKITYTWEENVTRPIDNSWGYQVSGYSITFDNFSDKLIYSNHDIREASKGVYGDVLFSNTEKVDFTLDHYPFEKTTDVPVKIFTDWFNIDIFSDLLVQWSYDNEHWENCSWGRYFDPDTDQETSLYRFELDVYNNDTYYFRCIDLKHDVTEYKTVVIDNIVYTQENPRRLS